jgi:hypothetical protein
LIIDASVELAAPEDGAASFARRSRDRGLDMKGEKTAARAMSRVNRALTFLPLTRNEAAAMPQKILKAPLRGVNLESTRRHRTRFRMEAE